MAATVGIIEATTKALGLVLVSTLVAIVLFVAFGPNVWVISARAWLDDRLDLAGLQLATVEGYGLRFSPGTTSENDVQVVRDVADQLRSLSANLAMKFGDRSATTRDALTRMSQRFEARAQFLEARLQAQLAGATSLPVSPTTKEGPPPRDTGFIYLGRTQGDKWAPPSPRFEASALNELNCKAPAGRELVLKDAAKLARDDPKAQRSEGAVATDMSGPAEALRPGTKAKVEECVSIPSIGGGEYVWARVSFDRSDLLNI